MAHVGWAANHANYCFEVIPILLTHDQTNIG